MPELIRSIANRLRDFIGNRRHAPRHRVRLAFEVSLRERKTGIHVTNPSNRPPPTLAGYTRDVSTSGLGLIVPAIRIGDRYLTDEGRILLVRLDLPNCAPIELNVAAVRYEQLEPDDPDRGYLIGARITTVNDCDRALFVEYIGTFTKQ